MKQIVSSVMNEIGKPEFNTTIEKSKSVIQLYTGKYTALQECRQTSLSEMLELLKQQNL